jgi:hypothetical protein
MLADYITQTEAVGVPVLLEMENNIQQGPKILPSFHSRLLTSC